MAAGLLREEELEPVRAARQALAQPGSNRGGLVVQAVCACAHIVAPRTIAIDEAVTTAVQATAAQVVLVGAGLDTRAWRLPALNGTIVFSVDHPASQAETRARAAGLDLVAGRLVFVPADLSTQQLDSALESARHDPGVPTVWVWEGVVPYLTKPEVAVTVRAIAGRSAPGSLLVVNYQTPSLMAALGRRAVGAVERLSGVASVTADEPWRSLWSPASMSRLLGSEGFAVQRDTDLLDVARETGSPAVQARSLRNGRVAVAGYTGRTVAG
jgi:methyltransferase (TIGR00027 family)